MNFFLWSFLALLVCFNVEAKLAINATELRVDNRLPHTNRVALENYLFRFIGKSADSRNVEGAKHFLSSLYFVSEAHCAIEVKKSERKLRCDVKPKYLVRAINIRNLSASLLESELKRKLPLQLGQMIDFTEKNIDRMRSLTRTRIETFLRKNGFYGGKVSVQIISDAETLSFSLEAVIERGAFARVNSVRIQGDSPLKPVVIHRIYERMCLSFNRIFDALSLGSLSCYSAELEREATEKLQERLANMGYVKASIRVGHQWIDPHRFDAPKQCRKKDEKDFVPRCIDLLIDIKKGPLVRWSIVMKEGHMVSRNGFVRLMGTVFAVNQLSRATASNDSNDIPSDRLIIKQELERRVNFIEAKNLDEQELSVSVKQMTEYLVSRGYINAKVVPVVITQDQNNIFVEFHVYPGRPFSIREVRVLPYPFSSLFKEEELYDLVKPRSFTASGVIQYSQISDALDKVIEKAQDKGYSDVAGKAEISAYDVEDVRVDFFLQGPARETIAQLNIINGDKALNEQVLQLLKNCDNFVDGSCAGSSLVRNSIEADEAKITTFYQSNDYLYARVKSVLKKSGDGYDLSFYMYDERYGPESTNTLNRQIIKDIIISGHSVTKDSVIKRLFPQIKYGQDLNSISLKKGVANLRESGRFVRIDHKLMAGQENSEDVFFALQLVERPSLTFDTALSISTDQLLSLEAEVEESNLFASMLTLKTKLGLGFFWGRQSSLTNKFVWPFIWGKPFSFTLQAPMIIYDDKLHRRKPLRRLQSRVVAALDWRASPHLMPYIRYSLVHNKETSKLPSPKPTAFQNFKNLDGLIPLIQNVQGKIAGVLRPGITFVNLDNPFDPRSGLDTNNWFEISGGILLGKPPFLNLGTQNRYYIPLGSCTLALQATLMRAFIEPNAENFSHLQANSSMDMLGGDRTVRGYDDSYLGIENLKGPPDKFAGYLSNIANVEFRFPLSEAGAIGKFSGALFVDQGSLIPCKNLWDCNAETSFKKLIDEKGFGLSVGAGLRYILPVGPISLDYGISLLHPQQRRIHFQFGYSF